MYFLLFIKPVETVKPQYDPRIAKYLHLLCYESYFYDAGRCIPNIVQFFGSYHLYKSDVIICDEANNRCGYYILVSDTRKSIIIVFSGTLSGGQLTKQTFSMFKKYIFFYNSGSVNRYYAKSFGKLWHHVKLIFQDSKYINYKVYVTGHSLGSAYASLTAFMINYEKYRRKEDIFLYTFGGPRIGTYYFSINFDKRVPNSWRVVVGSDIVPHFPPCNKMKGSDLKFYKKLYNKKSKPCDPHSYKGYYHHGTEIWYPKGTNGIYIRCSGFPRNEDLNCSDGLEYKMKYLGQYRRNHSIYFKDLVNQYFAMFYFKPNKNCRVIKDPKNRRIQLDE